MIAIFNIYNHIGQPVSIEFTDGGYLSYRYDKDGVLVAVDTYALLTGKRPKLVNERRYCDNFVLEGDSLLYVNFPGGYFDGNGRVHYRHADFQGNTTMVTDASGTLEQHTGYYPYGEPWREPTGQPYLYGGKERMRDGALNDYDFTARRLNSALCLWSTPDPCALDYGSLNPYIYCAANPIKNIDPSGCATFFMNKDDKLVNIGTDSIDDGRMFIVNQSLGEKISKYTTNKKKYNGEVGNSEDMAEITNFSASDFDIMDKSIEDGNSDGYERGMHKDNIGVIHEWDKGTEVYETTNEYGTPILIHSIGFFKENNIYSNQRKRTALWYMHIHTTNKANSEFGNTGPSMDDYQADKKARDYFGFTGVSFVIHGKNNKVTFYYKYNNVCTVPYEVFKTLIKNLNK